MGSSASMVSKASTKADNKKVNKKEKEISYQGIEAYSSLESDLSLYMACVEIIQGFINSFIFRRPPSKPTHSSLESCSVPTRLHIVAKVENLVPP